MLRPPGCAGDPLRGAQRRSLGSVVRRVRGKETRGAFQERVAADRAAEPLCYAVGHCCDTATAFARREVTRAALRAGRRCATPLCLNTGPSAQRTRTERPRAPAGTEPRAAPLPLRDRGAALLSRCPKRTEMAPKSLTTHRNFPHSAPTSDRIDQNCLKVTQADVRWAQTDTDGPGMAPKT